MVKFVMGGKHLFVIIISFLIILNSHYVIAQNGKTIPPKNVQDTEASQEKYVSIDFNDVDIRVFIKFISELTDTNFVIDNRVKGNINIISPDKITVKEAYKVFESVLEVHGFTTVKAGKITKIIPIATARSKNVETRFKKKDGVSEDKIVTQLITLKYADVNAITKLIIPLVSRGSVVLAYPPTNTLIITDIFSNIKRLIKIINAIDVKDVGRQLSIIPIEHASAVKLVKTLRTLFRATNRIKGRAFSADQASVFVADERTNILIVLANEFKTLKIKKLIAILDKNVPKSDAKIHVYYLKNAKAEELATVLQSLSGNVQKQNKGKKKAPLVSDKVKITADKATNSLIIMADKDDYNVLETVIKKLDITRPMVYIEALIMEVRDTDNFTLGVEWMAGGSAGEINSKPAGIYGGFTKENSTSGISALPAITNGNTVTPPGGFSMGLMGVPITIGGLTFPNLGAAIRAMKQNSKVHIISTPQIMTLDNEEAQISVGENVPYKTTSGSGDQNYESFEYKDVAVTLKITPQISQDRFVRLNIMQKVEKVASTENNTPTTLKRTIETTVMIKDASTIVIGGLIGEDLNATNYTVPCLGGIPLMGHLFKSTTRESVQTNLYVFLTPHIIENPSEAKKIYQDKHRQMSKITGETIKLYKNRTKKKVKN